MTTKRGNVAESIVKPDKMGRDVCTNRVVEVTGDMVVVVVVVVVVISSEVVSSAADVVEENSLEVVVPSVSDC